MLKIHVKFPRENWDLDLQLDFSHPVVGVFGPSGAGKSTLLHLLAGFLRPIEGEISFDGCSFFSSQQEIFLPPENRGIGYVFQESRLFPHLSVRDNLLYGAKTGSPGGADGFSFDKIVELLQLNNLLGRNPRHLSGGEKQRVALGRALLTRPRFLLLDEPLANVDPTMKNQVVPFLRQIRNRLKIPMIYVSHHLAEILQLTDYLVCLSGGRIQAFGHYLEILRRRDVYPLFREVGIENIIPALITRENFNERYSEVKIISPTGAGSEARFLIPKLEHPEGCKVFLSLPAEGQILVKTLPAPLPGFNAIPAVIREHLPMNGDSLVILEAGVELALPLAKGELENLQLNPGDAVHLAFRPESVAIRDICICR